MIPKCPIASSLGYNIGGCFLLTITKVIAILLKKSNSSDYYFLEAEMMLIIQLVKSNLATFSG